MQQETDKHECKFKDLVPIEEKAKLSKHPYKNQSYQCPECKECYTTCCVKGCNDFMCDWWYSLKETSDKVYERYDQLYCQYHFSELSYDSEYDSDYESK